MDRIEEGGVCRHYSRKLNNTIIYIGIVTILFNIIAMKEWLFIVLLVLVIEFLSIIFESFLK